MRKQTLMETTSNAYTGGIFVDLSSLSAPWSADIDGTLLNLEYYGNHSGRKIISPLVESLLTEDSVTLTAQNQRQLAQLAMAKYGKNWERLYDTLSLEYNPINNYEMEETEEELGTNTGTVSTDNATTYGKKITHTGTQTDNDETTYGKTVKTDRNTDTKTQTDYGKTENVSGTDTTQKTDSKTTTPDTTTDTTGQVYAFDSASWENADHQTQEQSGTVSESGSEDITLTTQKTAENGGKDTVGTNETESVTDATTGTDTASRTRTDDLSDAESGTDDFTGTRTDDLKSTKNRTLTRSGNIGVTTSQQMIESERNLWLWNFMEIVYADLDKILTIDVYHI